MWKHPRNMFQRAGIGLVATILILAPFIVADVSAFGETNQTPTAKASSLKKSKPSKISKDNWNAFLDEDGHPMLRYYTIDQGKEDYYEFFVPSPTYPVDATGSSTSNTTSLITIGEDQTAIEFKNMAITSSSPTSQTRTYSNDQASIKVKRSIKVLDNNRTQIDTTISNQHTSKVDVTFMEVLDTAPLLNGHGLQPDVRYMPFNTGISYSAPQASFRFEVQPIVSEDKNATNSVNIGAFGEESSPFTPVINPNTNLSGANNPATYTYSERLNLNGNDYAEFLFPKTTLQPGKSVSCSYVVSVAGTEFPPALQLTNPTGTIDQPIIVSDDTLLIEGDWLDPDSSNVSVRVKVDDYDEKQFITEKSQSPSTTNHFSKKYDFSDIAPGNHQLTFRAKDSAGLYSLPITLYVNVSGSVAPIDGETDQLKDITPPDPPTINPVGPHDNIITGTGEPGGTIMVELPSGEVAPALIDANGRWIVEIPSLASTPKTN